LIHFIGNSNLVSVRCFRRSSFFLATKTKSRQYSIWSGKTGC